MNGEAPMTLRRSERMGWALGWTGGFVWVLIVAVVVWSQGGSREGLVGIVLFIAALVTIWALAPWRHPATSYWRLMLPIYALFAAAVWWGVWALDDARAMGITGWSVLLLLPLTLPLWLTGRRRWTDGAGEQPTAAPTTRSSEGP